MAGGEVRDLLLETGNAPREPAIRFLFFFRAVPQYCGWTKSISHHFETMVNHCLLVFTWESNHSRVSWVVRNGFRNHPQKPGHSPRDARA